ncbi:two-component response regulator [Methylibium petroleiphilum PM1]|uniref:Two-component response regulator n=2 Tax=Methylibium TaxID=316612 RepID=A2SDY4_METPP|nr:two-component response regulator [Methylibium petroleiphilum PM1]
MTGGPARPVVYVVDDDHAMREALSSLIRSAGMRVEVFESATTFLKSAWHEAPSCLVLDVRMPEMNGLDLQRHISASGKHIPVIFISGHGDIPMTVRAIKAGAVEFLPKPFSDQCLLDAIAAAFMVEQHSRSERAEVEQVRESYGTLTAREREVLVGVVKGLRNKQVAFDLGITEETVKVHRHRLMQKMSAKSLPELVRMVERLRSSAPD